jgi:signal transduction histidine kinase
MAAVRCVTMGAVDRVVVERAKWRSHRIADGPVVLLVTCVALGSLIYRASQGPLTPAGGVHLGAATVLAVLLLLVGTLSLMWRPPAALPVLVVSGAAFVVSELTAYTSPLLPLAPLMALCAVAANLRPAVSAAAAAALAGGAFAVYVSYPGSLDDDFLDYVLAVGASWLLGYGVRLNRERASQLEDAAQRLAQDEASRTQSAVEQERMRIARELHDIVAHHLVVIVAQAGASRRMFDKDPEQARRALESIETMGRGALTETRRLVGVLWVDEAEQAGSKAPQPGLKELPALIEHVERVGLPVRLAVRGEPRPLPAGVELNAYRIVQEALTNTLKHAGPTSAEVVLDYQPESLQLSVRDLGRGSTNRVTAGHGLVGMRQRAAVLGGHVAIGPQRGAGFQVTAELPVNGERR